MGKADFLYFEVEAPKGINLIMFWNEAWHFLQKSEKNHGAFLSNKPFYASQYGL